MRYAIVIAVALAFATATTARADFVIQGAPAPQPPQPLPPVAASVSAPGADVDQATATDSSHQNLSAPPKIQWKTAYGFGNAVPLGFACRQIVPAAVAVAYGLGAKPTMVVSWKGGDTWNHVLRDAVQPLGLHLVMTHMAVEITK